MSDWLKLQGVIEEYQQVILLVHEKPDGDCLGSALALGLALQGRGKSAHLYLPEAMPAVYKFLPGQELVKVTAGDTLPEDALVIAVDCGDEARWDYVIPSANPLVNIDHHTSNTFFGQVNIVDVKAAAAGEIIYRILVEGNIKVTPAIATCLYTAIATDTGTFRFSNVTGETFRITGKLVVLGADLNTIRFNLYENRPLAELLTMKKAMEKIFFTCKGKVAGSILSYADLAENNLFSADTDGLVGILRGTAAVEVALLFKEIEPGLVRISLRSKSYLNVSTLAAYFQGGGHPRAAGCTIRGDLDEIVKDVLARTSELLQDGEAR